MDRLAALATAALVALALAVPAEAGQELQRSEDLLATCRLTVTTNPKPVILSTGGVMSCAWSHSEIAQRKQFCVSNDTTYSTNTVRISSFAVPSGSFASYGWPTSGTEKQCHDFGANIPIWIWHDSSNTDQDVTLMVTK